MKKYIVAFCCLLIVSFFACENEEIGAGLQEESGVPTIPINFEENFGSSITARFLGSVVDENSNPVQGAIVRIGNTVTSTDIFGIFSIENATAFEQFAYITVEKSGYITGSRAVVPSETEVNRIEIMLLEEEVIATVNSGENSIVSLPNGATVTFDGGFTKADGSVHSGAVQVVLHHLNPEDENMNSMMPGMLYAQDESGNAVSLETYGMLAVELRSDTGEELQLAAGSVSELRMPVAASTTNPPATIPLWYFDEETGYWKEEGQATLQGNTYVGEVTHFSFWNYDFPRPPINLCITLVDEEGREMTYTPFNIYTSLQNITGSGYTDAVGTDCGLVPSGEELIVTVPDSECNGEIFTTTIGPFSTDTNINITVVSTENATLLSGTFLTCDGNNITNGYLQLILDDELEIIPITDGIIDYMMNYCGTVNYSIQGIDVTNNQTTDLINGTLGGEATLDLGAINACVSFADTDGDGIFDLLEDLNQDTNLDNDDTDQDGIPNYQDPDDDGDGINTADEDYDGDNDPTNEDSDGDGIPDYLDAEDVVVFSTQVQSDSCADPQVFDFSTITTNLGDSLHSYAYYATEADANAETNPLPTAYSVSLANLLSGTIIYVKATNNTSSQAAIGEITLLSNTQDTDGDGLTDCEELTGIDDPSTPLVPSGTSDPNDPNDPNVTPVTIYMTMPETVVEGIGQIPVTFTLGATSDVDTVVDVATVDDTAGSGVDYTSVNTTITIPAGQLSEVVNIPITDDQNPEGDQKFFFINGTVTSGNTTITNISERIILYDNDPINISMFDSFGYENDSGIEVKVILSVPVYVDTVVDFSISSNTTTSPTDYSLSATSAVIPAGEVVASIFVIPDNDAILESTESFVIQASINSSTLNISTSADVYIYDDDNTDYRDFAVINGCDFFEQSTLDFTTLDAHFLNGNPGTVTYFVIPLASQASPFVITTPESYNYNVVDITAFEAEIQTQVGTNNNLPIELQLNGSTSLHYSSDDATVCDSSDGNNSNGIGVINLVSAFKNNYNYSYIVQTINMKRTYHESQSDAENGINAIVIPENYTTTSSSQTIYVRIEEPYATCVKVRSFTVNVDPGC